MKGFIHINKRERQRIELWLKQEKSLRWIAGKLGRSVSSVSDEIRLNSVDGLYTARKANHKAYVKRKYSKIQCLKVSKNQELREYVTKNIEADQSPEGISGRLKYVETDLGYASAKSIYKFVWSPYGRQIEKHLYSKAVKKKSGPKRGASISIDGRTMIDKRHKKVENRLEFGHFEGDFIESGRDGKGSLLVLVERKTRYPFLKYLDDRSTETVNHAVNDLLASIDVQSLTIDNDISFQKHEELSELLDALVFFCHPHAPHEKGTVENRNKAIRRYIPKRSDLSSYSKDYIALVEAKLRDRFMKCLRYKTPREAFETELQKQKKPQQCGMMKNKLSVKLFVN